MRLRTGARAMDDFPDGKRLNSVSSPVSSVQSLSSEAVGKSVKVPFPCQSYGMVGFIKELVDEQGAASVTMILPTKEHRVSKFKHSFITTCIVFVIKIVPTL